MQKIPTVFKRDPENMSRVLPEVNPVCAWVLAGEGVATRKYDGACVLFDGIHWWSRREVKPGKSAPFNFEVVSHDDVTGKTVGWEPAEQSAFWKYLEPTIEDFGPLPTPGTYEFCGPKVNGNPEGFDEYALIRHGDADVIDAPRDFDKLRVFLADFPHEGIVWHHEDGRMAKLKVRDFAKVAA